MGDNKNTVLYINKYHRVERILDRREVMKGRGKRRKMVIEYLVRWEGYT